MRDVNLHVGQDRISLQCLVRIAVDGHFRGSSWFRFGAGVAQCEAFTVIEGRFSQSITQTRSASAFGNHAMINDGFLMSLIDRSKGPGVQVVEQLLLSSPDHRGAAGPMLFPVDLAIEYLGEEEITVAACQFGAPHFRMVDVPGLPVEHSPYDLWVAAAEDYV